MKSPVILACGLLAIAQATASPELIRLYEEEILAHDLYVALGKKHPDIMPLRNIPRSELQHRDALAGVLKTDGIDLPAPRKGKRFVSKGLDKTYKKWLAEGKKSERAACRVGVRLEDHDIADLRAAQASFPQHKNTLKQLESASNNHLRAFHRNLTSRGGDYQAEALSAADIEAILDDDSRGNCGPGAGNGKKGGKKGGRNGRGGKRYRGDKGNGRRNGQGRNR